MSSEQGKGALRVVARTIVNVTSDLSRAVIAEPRARILTLAFLACTSWATPSLAAVSQLSVEARVECKQRIEEVYAKHRDVPAGTKAVPFVFDKELTRARIEDQLRQSSALQSIWHRPLTGDAISAEISRIEHNTHDPARLRELYQALANDPILVGECLVRPELTEHSILSAYANDRSLHEAVRTEAEAAQRLLQAGVRPDGTRAHVSVLNNSKLSAHDLNEKFPSELVNESDSTEHALALLIGHVGRLIESNMGYYLWRVTNSGVVERWQFEKVPFEEWWKQTGPAQRVLTDVVATNTPLASLAPTTCEIGTWTPTAYSNDFASKSRSDSFSVWDGSEMLVFGPAVTATLENQSSIGGAVYNPATDSWHAMSHIGQLNLPLTDNGVPLTQPQYFDGVWTGTELIVWGGCEVEGGAALVCFQLGARYNPATDTWQGMSEVGAAAAGATRSLTWTGSRMFAWNGTLGGSAALYDPLTNAWTPAASPPVGGEIDSTNSFFGALWTGTEVLEFGYSSGNAAYNPATNKWRLLSSSGAVPYQSASPKNLAWTGTEALVLSDYSPYPYTTDYFVLYRYNPLTNAWSQASTAGMPSERSEPLLIWAGDRLVVWGGQAYPSADYLNDGAMYFPSSNAWAPTRIQGAPVARVAPLGVWSGQEVLAWGGSCSDTSCWTGGRLNVMTNLWTPMARPDDGAPFARSRASGISDGSVAYIWGGFNPGYSDSGRDGGIFDPTLDTWTPIVGPGSLTDVGGPSIAVKGGLLSTFGGVDYGGTYQPTGASYNLQSKSWASIPAPPWSSARLYYVTGNDGNYVVVWGGQDAVSALNTGYVYNLTLKQWSAMATANAPAARVFSVSVGHEGSLYVYGGTGVGGNYDDGGIYNPATNTWSALPQSGDIPTESVSQNDSVLVDLGTKLLLWTTSLQQAWTYNLATGVWIKSTMSGYTAITPNYPPSIVWDGKESLFFGGSSAVAQNGLFVPNGWAYNPASDQWRPLETFGSPDGRQLHTGLMAGQYMMVWGGVQNGSIPAYTGGLYCPDTRTGVLSADVSVSAGFVHPVIGFATGPTTLRAFAHNAGGDAATQVHVSIDTGGDLVYNSLGTVPATASCTTPSAGTSGVVDCTLGTLDSGVTQMLAIQLSPFATGEYNASVAASGNEPDPQTPNNSATAKVTVVGTTDEIFSSGFE